jgi:hypothetical protein
MTTVGEVRYPADPYSMRQNINNDDSSGDSDSVLSGETDGAKITKSPGFHASQKPPMFNIVKGVEQAL